ncbi:MAG: hypothetical protein U5L96_12000 [Owenweeksia sp.]|nr:hypothetical protein [Owenweeksia sp.]
MAQEIIEQDVLQEIERRGIQWLQDKWATVVFQEDNIKDLLKHLEYKKYQAPESTENANACPSKFPAAALGQRLY